MIGIIGGMGPYASSYLYHLLLEKSRLLYGAKDNDDYPEVVIDSVPVPDFISDTKHLDFAKRMLVSRIKRLKVFGCDRIYMACNSGHLIQDDFTKASNGKFVSLISLVSKRIRKSDLRIGILATPTTIREKLYDALAVKKRKVVYPAGDIRREMECVVRDVIAGKKGTKQARKLEKLTRKFVTNRQLDIVVLGCTELPLVFPKGKFKDIGVIDSLEVLANDILKNYYGNKKSLGGVELEIKDEK